MRRLLLLAVATAAAASFSLPAHAADECQSQGYGVRVGDVYAGVCAGTYCADECWVELGYYCYGDAPAAKLCPAVGSIGQVA